MNKKIKTFYLSEEVIDKLNEINNGSALVQDLLAEYFFKNKDPAKKNPADMTAQDFLDELDDVKKEKLSEQDEVDRELAICVKSLKQQGIDNPTEEQVTNEYKAFQRMKAKRAAMLRGVTLTEEDLRRIENGPSQDDISNR